MYVDIAHDYVSLTMICGLLSRSPRHVCLFLAGKYFVDCRMGSGSCHEIFGGMATCYIVQEDYLEIPRIGACIRFLFHWNGFSCYRLLLGFVTFPWLIVLHAKGKPLYRAIARQFSISDSAFLNAR